MCIYMQAELLSETGRRYRDELLELGVRATDMFTFGVMQDGLSDSTIAQLREFVNIYRHGVNRITAEIDQLLHEDMDEDVNETDMFTRYLLSILQNDPHMSIILKY